MKSRILFLIAVFILPLTMWANNIRVKLNSYNPTTKQLNITLAWDNSWHDGSGTFRDGAWLFVKYKDVTNAEWQHASLTAVPLILTDTASGFGVKFDAIAKNPSTIPAGSRGYIIRRQKNTIATALNDPAYAGVYNVAMNLTATVSLPAGVVLANPEFRVYALEMVDVPAAAFYLGDGSLNSAFSVNTTSPASVLIGSENALTVSYSGSSTAFPATYPKGFAEFFAMKYELSCEGYAEFLNTLSRAQQNTLVGYNFATVSAGTIALSSSYAFSLNATVNSTTFPATITATNPYKAMIIGSSIGSFSYLDWAGLRPLSAMEYEKACRGPLAPVQGEYAWGSTVMTLVGSPDIDINGVNESYSATIEGPYCTNPNVRCGAFAKGSGSTRVNTGGTYYGLMEMSGNVDDFSMADISFTNTYGDGALTTDGNTDIATWLGLPKSVVRSKVSQTASTFSPNINGYGLSVSARGVIK